MAGGIDIGGYFDKLTRRGRGGRRLDAETGVDAGAPPSGEPGDQPTVDGTPSGGLRTRAKDAVDKGKGSARRTAERVRDTAARPRRRRRERAEVPPESVVTIEYSPREDGDPDPGEVVWAWVPFEEDPSLGKDRPVVIIGRRGPKLVGIPLTTKQNDHEAQLELGTGGWDPKRRTSYARLWRMLDVDPDQARREGAILDIDRFERLVAMVDRYYDVRRPSSKSTSAGDDWEY